MILNKLFLKIDKKVFFLFLFDLLSIVSLFSNSFKGFALYILFHGISVAFFIKSYKIKNKFIIAYSVLIPFFPIIFLVKKNKTVQEEIERIDPHKLFLLEIKPTKRKFGESTINNLIENHKAPQDLRLKAFIILSELITPKTVLLLKKGLSDPNDEIRLLCFSVLNNLEKNIQNQIHSTNKEKDDFIRNKNLAKLYWELIYLNLADKEFKEIILKQIYEFIENALKIKKEKELLFFKAKIYIHEHKYEPAYEIFKNFKEDYQVVPFLLEIYFYKKEYKKVKELIKKYPQLKLYDKFYFIYRLWND